MHRKHALRSRWKALLVLAVAVGALLLWKAWADTMGDPVVRRTSVALDGLSQPVTVVLISDIHVAGPDMPPARLERIVAQINTLQPDAVMIAGDLVSEKGLATRVYPAAEIIAPLAGLRAPLGTVLVPGNHDHWFDWPALRAEAEAAGIVILENDAAQIGPLAVGGLDDHYTGKDDLPAVLQAMQRMRGGRLLLTHSPDITPDLPEDVPLVLAGHTHCGQISFPIIGPVATMSEYGNRYACGVVREDGRTIVTGAGLGTSVLPIRFGTQAEIWLIELVPPE